MTTATLLRASYACLTAGAAVALLTASVQTSPAPAGAALEPLFTQATRTAPPPPGEKDPALIRRAPVEVSDKALASGVILSAEAHLLNFFPDVELVALRSRVESRSRSDYSWFGYIPGDEFGRVVITVVRGKLGVSATYKDKRYVVLAATAGGHKVLELKPDAVFEASDIVGAPPRPADGLDGQVAFGSRTSGRVAVGTPLDTGGMFRSVPWELVGRPLPGMTFAEDPGDVIEVLVLYTHDAVTTSEFDLHTEIQIAVDHANDSFLASGIQTTLKMVPLWALEVDFQESGDFTTDVNALASNTSIGELRNLVAADLVVLFVGSGDRCGGAFVGESFAVVKATAYCMGQYSFAHEVGHMMGARHDWYTHSVVDAHGEPEFWENESDEHGYIQIASWEPGGAIRTIMAYQTGCFHLGITCDRKLRWSKPDDLTQNNLPLGIWQGLPRPANDSRVLSANRHDVANRKHSVCRSLPGC